MRASRHVTSVTPTPANSPVVGAILVVITVQLALVGCVAGAGRFPPAPVSPFGITSLDSGDPARRASNRLLVDGLRRDAEGRPAVALGLYQRALQVDPINPYAFLVIARHHAEGVDPERALSFLDKAEALLDREPDVPRGVEPHILGLRGSVLYAEGQHAEGAALLERARVLAPGSWSDGRLSASELR